MCNSDGEDRLNFRSDRIASHNGAFYFSEREGMLEGVFPSCEQAEVAAALYIRCRLDLRLDSAHHEPDEYIYRYVEHAGRNRRAGERQKKIF